MFNPIYNEDGSVSLFRVSCIVVAVGCLICGCVVQDKKAPKDAAETAYVNSQSIEEAKPAVVEVEEPDEVDARKVRAFAVNELKDNFEYMLTCGTLDHGFDNCSVELDPRLTPYYEMTLDSASDGFALSLKALPSLNDSQCSMFMADSNGGIKAYNADGSSNHSCLDSSNAENVKWFIRRDTDNAPGQLAPSGLTPMVKTLTSN